VSRIWLYVLLGLMLAAPQPNASYRASGIGQVRSKSDAAVEKLVSELGKATPRERHQLLLELAHLAYAFLVQARPDPSGRAATDALLAIKREVALLAAPELRDVLAALDTVPDDLALSILVDALAHEDLRVRRQASESLLTQARHFAAFPRMPAAFTGDAVFRAANEADAEVRRDCRCVLRIFLANLQGGSAALEQSPAYFRLLSTVKGVSLDACFDE
jgi:hypothetical protein